MKVVYKENEKGDEYALFKRVPESEEEQCQYLDEKDLFVKFCIKCKRVFNTTEEYCDKCVYTRKTKNHEEGERYKLNFKISNKDICTLERGKFTIKR